MSNANLNAKLAYDLCSWVDDGANGNPPSPWQTVWQPSKPGAGYSVILQNSSQPTTYAVVVQGTKNLGDAIFDMEVEHQTPYPYVNGTNVAVGALDDLKKVFNIQNSAQQTMIDFLQSRVLSANQFWVTGHSLGGATTGLLAPWIAYVLNGQKPVTALPANITAITFAAPAIGDTNFANFLNNQSNYSANCNVNDAVPHAWCLTGQFSIPKLYQLFPSPGPSPMPQDLQQIIEGKINKMQKNGVSYQQTNVMTFTFPSKPETEPPDKQWLAEMSYQHNVAYSTYFGN